MHSLQRMETINELLKENEYLTVIDMSERLGVSLPTIRKDFDYLSENSKNIVRVRGGITLVKNADDKALVVDFEEREKKNIGFKKEIALKAIREIEPYDTILIDSSSTSFELADLLSRIEYKVTVITDGISTALRLKENPYLSVVIVGGVVKPNSNSIDDEFGSNTLNAFNIDKYFFSASGISNDAGLTEYNIGEIRTKERMIKKVSKTYVLIDSSKFEVNSNLVFAGLEDIDYLISDSNANKDTLDKYRTLIKGGVI